MSSLYKKYRPTAFKQIVGQPEAVNILTGFVKKKNVPHAILFTGSSGCGKTTLARILRHELNCSDMDFFEVNAADVRGIESIRDIRNRMGLSPRSGGCRVWLIDESHQLTSDAQNALLKMLEDTPRHVYFFMASTNPSKMLPTIKTRCTEIKVKPISESDLASLVSYVCKKEKKEISEDVVDRITKVAEGSARKALVLLEQVMDMEEEEDQINAVESSDVKKQAIEIARGLMDTKLRWNDMAAILKGVDEDPESLRHMILGYATSVMLGGGKMTPRAYMIITCFQDNFFDSKRAGLVAACYQVIAGV